LQNSYLGAFLLKETMPPLGLISLGAEEWLQQFGIKESGVTENEYF
jgi:hypothetical protein